MTAHASTEMLSAYLDRELAGGEVRHLERHLEDCPRCREHLESLSRVVGNLRRLERAAPPPLLAGAVARRVALEGRPRGLVEKLEGQLSGQPLQSNVLLYFALILALAAIVYFFTAGVDFLEHRSIPVVVASPEASAEFERLRELRAAGRAEVAGRIFLLEGGVWRQEGLADPEPAAEMTAASEEGRALLDRHPELADLLATGRAVVLEDGGRVVRLTAGE